MYVYIRVFFTFFSVYLQLRDNGVLEKNFTWLCNTLALAVARLTCTSLSPCVRRSLTEIAYTKAALFR